MISQHPSIFHTELRKSTTHWSSPSVIQWIAFLISICKVSRVFFSVGSFTRSLHVVREMNACKPGHVCLFPSVFVPMIHLENRWTDLHETRCGSYAIGVYPKIVLISFVESVTRTWRTKKLVRRDRLCLPLQWGHTMMCGNRFSENTKLRYSSSL